MEFFSYLNDRTKHGLKIKIGMFLNKSDIWEEFIIEKELDVNKVNSYDRTILSKAIFNKEKEYILKGLISEISDEDILKEISMYIDYILPRSCYIKLGNKKENYNGIKTVEGLSYFYEENNDLDVKEYTGEDKVSAYKKEYFRYNRPYQKLNDTALFNMLQNNVIQEELYLRPEYDEPFNRVIMLKLLHHFYFKTEFEDVDKYICKRDEYYELLKDDLIDQYIIDKEIEVGDFVIFSGVKYVKELLEEDYTSGIGFVCKKYEDNDIKVDFPEMGVAERYPQEELKILDVSKRKEFTQYIQDIFGEAEKTAKPLPKEKTTIAGIPLLKNKNIEVINSCKLYAEINIKSDMKYAEMLNNNNDYCLLNYVNTKSNYYLVDKKTNEVYEFSDTISDKVKEKHLAFLEDILFKLNRLEPMLNNYYNDYSVFLYTPLPSINQLNLISKNLNTIYKKQLKLQKKYKKFFNEFEPPYRQNIYRVKYNIPKSKVGFENYSSDDIQKLINFLNNFNHENIDDMNKFKELFIIE